MHSILIISRELNVDISKYLDENMKIISYEASKIADTRVFIKLASNDSKEKIAFVINSFNDLSIEAQNSMLKILEEPGKNIYIVLISKSLDRIAETIISRCKVIFENKFSKDNYKINFSDLLKCKKREDAIIILQKIIMNCEHDLNLSLSSKAEETIQALEKNANVKLQLANFVIKV